MRGGVAATAWTIAAGSSVSARVRSTLHDATLRFGTITGRVELSAQARSAELRVDMRQFASGDRMLDWKVRGDLDPERWPEARFVASQLDGELGAAMAVHGQLAWRGREVAVVAQGQADRHADGLRATFTFDLDMRDLGITPPRLLLLKTEPLVSLRVELLATPAIAI